MSNLRIGCDIGNVLRHNVSGESVDGAVEGVNDLLESYEVVLISKCKESYKQRSLDWLEANNLSHLERHFVLEDHQKAELDSGVSYMIDDKIKVLLTFGDDVKKIWFTNDWKKINGARKYNPEWLEKVEICHTWNEIIDAINK